MREMQLLQVLADVRDEIVQSMPVPCAQAGGRYIVELSFGTDDATGGDGTVFRSRINLMITLLLADGRHNTVVIRASAMTGQGLLDDAVSATNLLQDWFAELKLDLARIDAMLGAVESHNRELTNPTHANGLSIDSYSNNRAAKWRNAS
jgi:hypothetical protein